MNPIKLIVLIIIIAFFIIFGVIKPLIKKPQNEIEGCAFIVALFFIWCALGIGLAFLLDWIFTVN